MGLFDRNYNKIIWEYLPTNERTPIAFAWLKALLAPLTDLFNRFKASRNGNLYKLTHNSQVCYLEAVLNDSFDYTLRRITVEDPLYSDPVYCFLDAEVKPVYIDLDTEIGSGVIDDPDPVPLFTDAEAAATPVCFIVRIPSAVYATLDLYQVKALIDYYRLAGMNNYIIISV